MIAFVHPGGPSAASAAEICRALQRLTWQARTASRSLHQERTRIWEPAGTVSDWSDCIVAIARARDRNQFAILFAHFAPRLKSFFLRQGTSPGAAEDLAQETMLAVWRKADRFDPERAAASTWIYTIARNLRVDLHRRERDPSLLAEFFEQAGEPLASDGMLSAERDERVQVALASLPEEQAQAIRLSFFEDRPHGEIARILDIPLGTVKSRIRLAMSRLRALVEDEA
jgi:RNA polymerase sigma-70 factor, ECF subfamily